jgi:hypothetical protein
VPRRASAFLKKKRAIHIATSLYFLCEHTPAAMFTSTQRRRALGKLSSGAGKCSPYSLLECPKLSLSRTRPSARRHTHTKCNASRAKKEYAFQLSRAMISRDLGKKIPHLHEFRIWSSGGRRRRSVPGGGQQLGMGFLKSNQLVT